MLKSKKSKIIGIVAGVMSLAIGAGATYAWYVSETPAVYATVNTATVNIEGQELTADFGGELLPGETITKNAGSANSHVITNNSTRDTIMRISIDKDNLQWTFNNGTVTPEREARLTDALVNSANASGITVTPNNNNVKFIFADETGAYFWVKAGQDINRIALGLKIPEILGGNIPDQNDAKEDIFDQDRPEEQNATITFDIAAKAVQNSEGAIIANYSQDVADKITASADVDFLF